MSKRIFRIVGITIFIVLCMFTVRKIINENNLKKEVNKGIEKLSEDAKTNLNYDELIKDIKAKNNGKNFVYAKKKELSGINKVENSIILPNDEYIGEGYYCVINYGEEITSYSFLSTVDDIEIY